MIKILSKDCYICINRFHEEVCRNCSSGELFVDENEEIELTFDDQPLNLAEIYND